MVEDGSGLESELDVDIQSALKMHIRIRVKVESGIVAGWYRQLWLQRVERNLRRGSVEVGCLT